MPQTHTCGRTARQWRPSPGWCSVPFHRGAPQHARDWGTSEQCELALGLGRCCHGCPSRHWQKRYLGGCVPCAAATCGPPAGICSWLVRTDLLRPWALASLSCADRTFFCGRVELSFEDLPMAQVQGLPIRHLRQQLSQGTACNLSTQFCFQPYDRAGITKASKTSRF